MFISIHTPLAGSDEYTLSSSSTEPISIHTPLAGSDPAVWVSIIATLLFQSTLPLRGATATDFGQGKRTLDFNPHSPCGERPGLPHGHGGGVDISIHTPLAGSDKVIAFGGVPFLDFNPHSPCGERLGCHSHFFAKDVISIHTPLAGSDWGGRHALLLHLIFQSTLPLRGATAEMRHF